MTKRKTTKAAPSLEPSVQYGRPRAYATHTNALPMIHRPGAMDANQLPRIEGPWRIWPDGRKEPR